MTDKPTSGPSDRAIAQAFEHCKGSTFAYPCSSSEVFKAIEYRARELDAAHPVVAFTPQAEYPVAGDAVAWMMELAKEIKANAEDHPRDYISKFALRWADILAARAVAALHTPAAQPADNAAGVQGSVSEEDVEVACRASWNLHGEDAGLTWDKAILKAPGLVEQHRKNTRAALESFLAKRIAAQKGGDHG